jgi:tetratricopeptide (TPR) repeat protein
LLSHRSLEMSMSPMRIFVSHNNTDTAFCDALVAALRGAGADVWYDEQSLGVGHLLEVITHEIEDRPVFVIVLSKAALGSRYVRQEYEIALTLREDEPHRVILPVVTQPIGRSDFAGIWLPLMSYKRIEAPGYQPYPQAEAIQRTLEHLTLVDEFDRGPVAPPGLSAEELNERGEALYYRREFEASRVYCERATQLRPDYSSAWYNLTYALNELGRFDEALITCDRVLALQPKHSYGWNLRGYILSGLGRHDEQLAACEKALELKPNLARNWANKAEALGALHRYQEALEACEHGLAITPESQFALNAKANILRLMHRYDEALTLYQRLLAARHRTGAAFVWNEMADVLRGINRLQEALAAVMCAIALEPEHPALWANAAKILKASNLRREGQEAERHVKKLMG